MQFRSIGRFLLPTPLLLSMAAPASAQDLEEMVPMRDGVRLNTHVYLPDSVGGPWPVILARTPYGVEIDVVSDPDWIHHVTVFREYAYVVQDMRGRFASEGADSAFWTDGWGALQDGYDTVEWIAASSWCDGNVGMHGGSARGIVQYLAGGAAPPALKACVARACMEDFYHKGFFQGGGYRRSLVVGWFNNIQNPVMREFYSAHPVRDAFWDQVDLHTRLDSVLVPTLHIGGHYGVFGESAIDAFTALQFGGGPGALGNQRMVVGPWTHDGIEKLEQGELVYPTSAAFDLHGLRFRWYDRWLKGEMNGVEDEPAVDFYLMGDVDDPLGPGNEWLSSDTFPPVVSDVSYYFHAGATNQSGTLMTEPPVEAGVTLPYVSDPFDPIITLGGRNLFLEAGPYDQAPVYAGRTDYLAFSTPPLTSPLVVAGKIRAHFWAACDRLDTDFCVKLIDVYPDGRMMLVTDGVLRARYREGFDTETLIEPGVIHEYEVDLWSTALVFGTGHQVQVIISGTNTPRFRVNPQNGGSFGNTDPDLVAQIIVRACTAYPSHLILPVAPALVGVPPLAALPPAVRVSRNPASRFVFTVTVGDRDAALSILDVSGRLVRRLTPSSAGGGRVTWDGRSTDGRLAATGVYFLGTTGVKGPLPRIVLTR